MRPFTMRTSMRLRSVALLLGSLFFTAQAGAAPCGGDFNTFLSAMARDAAAAGVSRSVIDTAFAGVTLATRAHDCRRSELFQRELIAALQIVQRGDLPLRDLVGAYAGEIGQTQFLPSSYIKYGVDYDGNGHVDLRHSVPDVLASTANLLKVNGWQAGQPFGEGTANFEVMREWNRSVVYRKTMAYFAERLGGQ